jgi:APA family basic amino acid/polyamine antiporter
VKKEFERHDLYRFGSQESDKKYSPITLLSAGVMTLLYLSLNIVFVYAVPPEEMKGVISIGGLAMGNLFGRSAETIFSLMIAFALFSSLSAFMILGPRVYYSMVKDGLFFRALVHVNPRFRVPARSIALQGAISGVMVLSGTFDQILTVMGFALGIFPLFAVAGVFRLKRSLTARTMLCGYPWAPMVYLATGVSIISCLFFQRPTESSIAILSVLVGVPVYLYFMGKYIDSNP